MIKINLIEGLNRHLRRMKSKKATQEYKDKHFSKAYGKVNKSPDPGATYQAVGHAANKDKFLDTFIGGDKLSQSKFKLRRKNSKRINARFAKRAGLTEGSMGQKRAIRRMASHAKKGDMKSFKKVMSKRLLSTSARLKRTQKDYQTRHSPGAVKFNKENPLEPRNSRIKDIFYRKS